ncbi:hypothetical protein [Sulfuricurvum sp.]|uniref:hypothetical protein n=1 Tax=Sulfuricurvum sp. TaxID=2025608 RepID=UPI00263663FD|nr:hypothetical protein [Sulfuricurvum sp.]MDD2267054.1 hypothetical protein [Sulfuricurvum sp.]
MKKSLKQYTEQHAPRKNASKLLPFYSEMKAMRDQGYSYRQISEALQENGINAYPSEIKRFMDRRDNQIGLVRNNPDGITHQKDYKDQFFEKFDKKGE